MEINILKRHKDIILLGALFLLEFALFRTCVQREIIGSCPRNIDQAVFMRMTYHMYENIVQGNFKAVFNEIQSSLGQGAFPVFGLIYMFLFGKSRLSLLSVNFTLFALAQATGFYSIKKTTNCTALGYVFIGLFLMIQSPFFEAGGLFDYRMDFSAFCLYTCWTATFMAAHYLKDKRMYYLSAVFCGLVLMFRSNTLAYIGIAFLLFECIYVFLLKEKKLKNEIINLIKYGCVVIVSGGWYILLESKALYNYYMTAHVTSEEPRIRMIEQGIDSIKSYLLFYPRSLYKHHLGKLLSCVLIFLIILALILYVLNKKKENLKTGKNEWSALTACLCGFLAPFIVLTIDISKSAVVICTAAGTAVILTLLFIAAVYNRNLLPQKVIYGMAGIGILAGIFNYIDNTTQMITGYERDTQKEMLAINECMEQYLTDNDLQSANLLVDRICDAITTDVLTVLIYENYDRYVDVRYAWNVMNTYHDYTADEVNDSLEKADLMVLSKETYQGNSVYPINSSYDKYRELMLQYADEHLYLLGEFVLGEEPMLIFGKAQAGIIPTWAEWMGTEKNWLFFNKPGNKQNTIMLEGNLGGGLNSESEILPVIEYAGKNIPCDVEIDNGRYRISIDISDLEPNFHRLELKFENCFVPAEMGVNEDTRSLVIMTPDNIEFK